MSDITNRFIDVYDYLEKEKKISNMSDFADKIGVSSSMISDIRASRTNPGINVIRGIVNFFEEIDGTWLLTGKGRMRRFPAYDLVEPHTDIIKNSKDGYRTPDAKHSDVDNENCQVCLEKERIILQQQTTIEALKESNNLLKSRLATLS